MHTRRSRKSSAERQRRGDDQLTCRHRHGGEKIRRYEATQERARNRRKGEGAKKVYFISISYKDLELAEDPLTIIFTKIEQAEELNNEEEKRAFMGDEKTAEELQPVATGQQDTANPSGQSRIERILQDIVSIAIKSQGGNDSDITAGVVENYTDPNRALEDREIVKLDPKITLAKALQKIITHNSSRGGAESKTKTTTADLNITEILDAIASLSGLEESDQTLDDSDLPQKLQECAEIIIDRRNKQTEEQKAAEAPVDRPSAAPRKSTTLRASATAFNPDPGQTR